MWHMTFDRWGEVNLLSKVQLPSSYSFFNIFSQRITYLSFWQKIDISLLIISIRNKNFCRHYCKFIVLATLKLCVGTNNSLRLFGEKYEKKKKKYHVKQQLIKKKKFKRKSHSPHRNIVSSFRTLAFTSLSYITSVIRFQIIYISYLKSQICNK